MKKANEAKKDKMNATRVMCLILAGLMVLSAASTIVYFIAAAI